MLLIRGCFVAEAIGDMDYFPHNAKTNYGDAVEGAAPTPAPAATAAAPKPGAGKDKELEAKTAADTKAKADAEQAEKAKQAAAKADNCKRAQQAKAMYDTGKAVRSPNEKGEMVFQDANQRAAEIKRTDDAIAGNC
jgi:hypothetical protein